ncbi:MAG TPA: TetR/AcrR family transcriptional regulator [Firmicutes bacterium]|jgi:AcrR family transcriptional regulator|nr:TetR/AcrR family transcriptional regulator [Bacillota bacterium]
MTQGGKACFFQEAGPGEKRAAILAAAMEIFSRDGFHKARVEDIAAQAGVGKGTVYEYFRGKQDLYQEMFHVGVDSYLKRIQRVVGQAGSVRERLRGVMAVHCDYLDISSQIMRLMSDSSGGIEGRQLVLAMSQRITTLIRDLIQEGIRAGELRSVDPLLAAQVFLGANHAAMLSCAGQGAQVSAAAQEVILDILFQGIAMSDCAAGA